VGCYFREEQLQKALAIVLSPGQATGQVSEALDIIQSAEESNKAIGKMSYCQDQVNISLMWPEFTVDGYFL
jgi:hypothetical protein